MIGRLHRTWRFLGGEVESRDAYKRAEDEAGATVGEISVYRYGMPDVRATFITILGEDDEEFERVSRAVESVPPFERYEPAPGTLRAMRARRLRVLAEHSARGSVRQEGHYGPTGVPMSGSGEID